MSAYKVIKDFPSRNGVTQYKAGQTIQLDENSRTKALVEMGYIEKHSAGKDLITSIAVAIQQVTGIKRTKICPIRNEDEISFIPNPNSKRFYVEVEEK